MKPSNVLLAPPATASGRWTAKLADFGIACTPETSKVRTGVVLGTAAYMAPEQLRDLPLTPAADIYSLGLVLLEALTGRHGYPIGKSLESARVRLTEPPEIPESVSEQWRRLILWMTQVEPEERPSAEEVARVVGGLRGATPAAASGRPDSTTERLPETRVLSAEPAGGANGLADSRASLSSPRRVFAALIAGAAAIGLLAAVGVWTSSAADTVTARSATVLTVSRSAPVATTSTAPVAVVDDSGPGPSSANDDKHAEQTAQVADKKAEHAAEQADKKAEHAAEQADKKAEHSQRGNSGKGK